MSVRGDGVFAQSLSTKVLHLHNIFGIEFDCLFKNFVANISDIENSLIFRIFNYGSRVICRFLLIPPVHVVLTKNKIIFKKCKNKIRPYMRFSLPAG